MSLDNNGRASARLLSFKTPGLPDLSLAVALQEVLEVAELGSITEIPCAPHVLLGLSEWRDRVVTVVDMANVLCKDTLPRPAPLANWHHLVVRVVIGEQVDAIAWSILPGASIIAAPPQAPQTSVPIDLRPQGIYAAVTLLDTPHVLLNLTGIVGYMMSL